MSNKELSASAIQIAEKRERIKAMHDLAVSLTKEQVSKIKQKNPNLSASDIVKRVKQEGIPKMMFLHEYITTKYSVSLGIAESYFEHLSKRLKPNFFMFNPQNANVKTHFHIEPSIIESIAKDSELQVALKSGKMPK